MQGLSAGWQRALGATNGGKPLGKAPVNSPPPACADTADRPAGSPAIGVRPIAVNNFSAFCFDGGAKRRRR